MIIKFIRPALFALAAIFCVCHSGTAQSNIVYDIVLAGGRVIDPETDLDAIRNVGIRHNRIAQISAVPKQAKRQFM